jgi:hypothetical protein
MVAGGVKKMASLVPESAVAKMTVDRMARQNPAEAPVTVGYEFFFFTSIEEARKWLLN